jgi:hypothetical protein
MMRRVPLLLFACVTVSCDAVPVPADSRTDSVAPASRPGVQEPGAQLITPDGWGPLRIGMSRAEVIAAAGDDANPGAIGGPDPAACDEFRPADAPAGVLVMIEAGVLTRVSVSRNTDIVTPAGFRVGASGSAVLRAYGAQASVTSHQYQASPAKYITVWEPAAAGQSRRGILYEVDSSDAVVFIRAGTSSIERVEGCV